MKACYWLILTLCLLFLNKPAIGHQLSTAYLNLKVWAGNIESIVEGNIESRIESNIEGSWQVRVRDLEAYIPFDMPQPEKDEDSGDGVIKWLEIMAKSSQVAQFTREQLVFSGQNGPCPLIIDPQLQLDRHFNQAYLVVTFKGHCQLKSGITLNYQAFFDQDANHKAIVNIENSRGITTRVFTESSREQEITLEQSSHLQTFGQYLYQGIVHIWQGTDHLLFLLVLILTACFKLNLSSSDGSGHRQEKWQVISAKKTILMQAGWLITAFTLAHSMTLTLTALGLLTVSSHYIEGIIALSVLFTAVNNIWPVVIKLPLLSFVFGLFHGMGFASVLAELGLAAQGQLLSILAFNLGVELGQLAILAVILPLLIKTRFKAWYPKYLIPTGSAVIAVVALQWTVARLFN